MKILLVSTYELGHQPLGLARPATDLLAAGHDVTCLDLSVEPFDVDRIVWADLLAFSVPMHTATCLAVRAAERARSLNPRAHLAFYGLYASLNADLLLAGPADSVVGGEFEQPLVRLTDRLANDRTATDGLLALDGIISNGHDGGVSFVRQRYALPARGLLPPLERYSRLDDGQREKLAGYVEASRGCAHRCLHCPITPVYRGRLRVVESEIVLEDIRQLVRLGAEHITFGDPDFFNGVRHSLRIVEQLHEEFPDLTYDVTIKVEHLIEHYSLLQRLAATGCAFVVSAVEALDDSVLANLAKGHTAADVEQALDLAEQSGLVVRTTFVPFTPWTTLDGYLGLLDFVERRQLVGHVDPIQFTIRLLVPRGSSLVGTPAMDRYLGEFDPASFTYVWRHPDARMDRLQRDLAALVERGAHDGEDPARLFQEIRARAEAAASRASSTRPLAPLRRAPRLTEPWFC